MEKVTFGLGVAGLGMIVVFVGLLILIGFITILGLVSRSKKPKAAPVKDLGDGRYYFGEDGVMQTGWQTMEGGPAVDGVPAEVIAAITAAIAAVWESPNGFVVRHVKRISNAPAWKRAGRDEQTYSRY